MSAASGTSATRATARGLPLSSDSSSASSSAFSRMRSPIFQISLPRSLGVRLRHGPDSNARRAAFTARLMSSLPLSGTRAITDASAGLNTSNNFPDAAGDHLPPIRFCFGFLSHAATRGPILISVLPETLPFPLTARDALRVWVGIREREAIVFITRRTCFLWVKGSGKKLTPGDKKRNLTERLIMYPSDRDESFRVCLRFLFG